MGILPDLAVFYKYTMLNGHTILSSSLYRVYTKHHDKD